MAHALDAVEPVLVLEHSRQLQGRWDRRRAWSSAASSSQLATWASSECGILGLL